MTRIEVETASRGYPVVIDEGLVGNAAEPLRPFARNDRLIIVSDRNVWALWGSALSGSLREGGIAADPIILAPGEESKSWATLAGLVDALLERGVERNDAIVALGGGVVGDLTGFAAAIVKRGCRYVQVPTTLLAQVDSSVGGKTAINTAAGKNLVGVFHQPSLVLIDPAVLATLPVRELRAGYAEVVKYGVIGDAGFFGWCEANGAALIGGDNRLRTAATAYCVRAKAAVVAIDTHETQGQRALLNFGHTFGHALEAATGFSERLLHGEAVALGMVLALRFSAGRGLCDRIEADRLAAHLAATGLPADLRSQGLAVSAEGLVAHMARDKKMRDGRLPFILARSIGDAFVDPDVDLAEIRAFLADELP